MTELQRYLYERIIHKDAVALNELGGPDRTKLLNILMQLRKVCNHPYLFDGTEPGPPFFDGNHIWESSGKMVMLHKLLSKLRAQGSRVLIFSQMTRMLDLIDDYLRYTGVQYCRIDSSTGAERRDELMWEFNKPDSDKFCFILSTRAGGLGINLATADVVILFDSDWNPQMDLQAQDRAHRIGQKKQVRVFRFVTQDTVEEKIIERADRKLFLDATVIQQGRLMQKNSNLSKNEAMAMIKFGADKIFKSKESTVSDEDIEAILQSSEERTKLHNEKIKSDMQHNLMNFTISGSAEDDSVLAKAANEEMQGLGGLVPLAQRERKANYNEGDSFRAISGVGEPAKRGGPKLPKKTTSHDFQFFDRVRLDEIWEIEKDLAVRRHAQIGIIKEAKLTEAAERRRRGDRADAMELDDHEPASVTLEKELETMELDAATAEEKQRLLDEGFSTWTRR